MVSLTDVRPVEERAWFKTERRDNVLRFVVGGDWTLPEAPRLDPKLRALDLSAREAEIDGKELDKLDSAGAWLLLRTKRALEDGGAKVRSFVIPESYGPLFGTLEREHKAPPTQEMERPPESRRRAEAKGPRSRNPSALATWEVAKDSSNGVSTKRRSGGIFSGKCVRR